MNKSTLNKLAAVTNPLLTRVIVGRPFPLSKNHEILVWCPALQLEAQVVVLKAINQLKAVSREVLVARYGEKMTLLEYANRIGRSKERVRQLEAKAFRRLRYHLQDHASLLKSATRITFVPGGALDPAWVTIAQARVHTGYSADHLRYLCSTGRVVSRKHPTDGRFVQILRNSLKDYTLALQEGRGRPRAGQWRG